MPRRATSDLSSKTARAKLKPRKQPYFVQVGPTTTLGYVRRTVPPGSWVRRQRVDTDGAYPYEQTPIGTADDVAFADGKTVFSYTQAAQLAANGGALVDSKPITVKRALDAYFTDLEGRSPHAQEARQRAEKHIIPKLGRYPVVKLTKTQVAHWFAGMVKDDPEDGDSRRRSQDTANRILTILKAALNRAFEDDANNIPSDNAWRKVKAFRAVEAAREDHFAAAQVRSLIGKAASFDRAFANLLEAAYLTGARLGELAGLQGRDFHAERAVLSIRKGKTGARAVTLTDEAVRFFKRVSKDRVPEALLLPRADGEAWGKSEQHRPFKRAAALAELPSSASFYTLRHSYISRAIEAGMPLSLLAENCGTSLTMIQRNYAHVLAATRRDTIEATAPKLRRVK